MYWSMDRLFSRCIMNVFCMYLELASTACMRCGDTWIMCGSHNTRPTCGIRPKYILIHDQIHVSVRGVSSPNWGGIMTMPFPVYMREQTSEVHHGPGETVRTPIKTRMNGPEMAPPHRPAPVARDLPQWFIYLVHLSTEYLSC